MAGSQKVSLCEVAFSGRPSKVAVFRGFRSSPLRRRALRRVGVEIGVADANGPAETGDRDPLQADLPPPERLRHVRPLGDVIDREHLGQYRLGPVRTPLAHWQVSLSA